MNKIKVLILNDLNWFILVRAWDEISAIRGWNELVLARTGYSIHPDDWSVTFWPRRRDRWAFGLVHRLEWHAKCNAKSSATEWGFPARSLTPSRAAVSCWIGRRRFALMVVEWVGEGGLTQNPPPWEASFFIAEQNEMGRWLRRRPGDGIPRCSARLSTPASAVPRPLALACWHWLPPDGIHLLFNNGSYSA